LNLKALLRSPELRQLDQRVSIRYELKPLDGETVAAYVAHRLTIAGGSASVAFTAKALARVHRFSGGIPRLINLICDRALLAGFSARASRITHDMVKRAAKSLDLAPATALRFPWLGRRASLAAGAIVILLASAFSVGVTAWLYGRFNLATLQASIRPASVGLVPPVRAATAGRDLPPDAVLTILAGSFPETESSEPEIRSVTERLEASGYKVYYASVDRGPDGRWQRVLANAYTDADAAVTDAVRLKAAAPDLDARVVTSAVATGTDR
jgi:general secretion pathway protein A